ncbi:hypothetical protein RhiirB3_435708 [Rhizophagus irregularis]|nr:hypothetical protein RhiirB3_435708 [Rhizophagus irregularis]
MKIIHITILAAQDSQCKFKQNGITFTIILKKNLTNIVGLLDSIQVKHIYGNEWSCILGDLDMGQMKGLGLSPHSLDTTCEWEVHIMNIFKLCHVHFQRNVKYIEKSDEDGVKDWIDYYQILHILATINSSASLMDVEIWNRYGNNTNAAEAAHFLVNRTQLFYDLSAFPYTKQDKSQVKKQLLAINRKGNMADPKTNLMNLRSKKVDIEERRLRLEFEIEERKIILRKR